MTLDEFSVESSCAKAARSRRTCAPKRDINLNDDHRRHRAITIHLISSLYRNRYARLSRLEADHDFHRALISSSALVTKPSCVPDNALNNPRLLPSFDLAACSRKRQTRHLCWSSLEKYLPKPQESQQMSPEQETKQETKQTSPKQANVTQKDH